MTEQRTTSVQVAHYRLALRAGAALGVLATFGHVVLLEVREDGLILGVQYAAMQETVLQILAQAGIDARACAASRVITLGVHYPRAVLLPLQEGASGG